MDPPIISPAFVTGDLGPGHLLQVARLHTRAFPKSALTLLGPEAVRRYYEWQLSGPHEVVARGVFQEDVLAGFCFGGVFRGALSGFLRKNRTYLVARLLLRPWLLTTAEVRGRVGAGVRGMRLPVGTAVASRPERSAGRRFGILSIATDPDHARRGIGRRLMEEMERVARVRGFASLNLTVHLGNAAAIRFYEGLGWVRVPAGDRWEGRMEKRLGP